MQSILIFALLRLLQLSHVEISFLGGQKEVFFSAKRIARWATLFCVFFPAGRKQKREMWVRWFFPSKNLDDCTQNGAEPLTEMVFTCSETLDLGELRLVVVGVVVVFFEASFGLSELLLT